MNKKILISILSLFPIYGCVPECYYGDLFDDITDYDVMPNIFLEEGIKLDDPLGEIDIEELKRQMQAFEKCTNISVKWSCITLKVPHDWYISLCSGQQLFPCNISDKVCLDKDLPISEECPCNCRATIQDSTTIIVTPNLLLFRGELARMITGMNNPWILNDSYCFMD
jgi:hypothetical protein